ncbi:MAG TPA: TrmH family RNA methyltransferase, partial [Gammaproteobacteria bacterium]|nr:TrmH family RNA methyltransferase [Gammaproteobacteria bacterium]
MQIPVRIVLVETSHPGNIGASARAMKTMGLADLALVQPRAFPDAEATARASGADDVLANARIFDSLEAAVADCGFVVGASARLRSVAWPLADPRGAAALIRERGVTNRTALVFGPEQSGLTNEHLALCQRLVR